jgi:hypothetical protein
MLLEKPQMKWSAKRASGMREKFSDGWEQCKLECGLTYGKTTKKIWTLNLRRRKKNLTFREHNYFKAFERFCRKKNFEEKVLNNNYWINF